jgi:hypothetical protein
MVFWRRVISSGVGLALAAMPALAAAQEEGSRALGAPDDLRVVMVVTVLGAVALFVAAGLGYLYRREQRLTWDFQRPDPEQHAEEMHG